MRLSKALITLTAAFLSLFTHAQQRAELHMFQYGRVTSEQRIALFEEFRYVLEEKMPKLSEELALGESLPVLNSLRIVPVTDEEKKLRRPSELIGTLTLRQRYWREVGALGLLTGVVNDRDEVPNIKTTLYWGELKPPLKQEMIELETPLTGDFFDSTFDSHSVAILYAFANQPDVSCEKFTSIISLLSEAHKRAKAVALQQPELGLALEKLIVESIESLRQECGR